jgi:hypothetical protein
MESGSGLVRERDPDRADREERKEQEHRRQDDGDHRSSKRTRSPKATSASPRWIGSVKWLITSPCGVKCQKNGASVGNGRTSYR